MATGDKSRDLSCYISQLRTFRSVMWTAEEDQSEGSIANGGVLWIFMSIEKGLELEEVVVRIQDQACGM